MPEENSPQEPGEEGLRILDFDMLCTTVALQTQGIRTDGSRRGGGEGEEGGEFGGGVQRMWEGGVLDCLDHRRIFFETSCCPCYGFGKNMRRAQLGPCFVQGFIYFVLLVTILFNFIAFGVTREHCYLYMGVPSVIAFGLYLGYFRTRIRKQFNIGGTDSSVDDCMHHLICPCCSLCQESRTLEMNNVLDGIWHGRGDAICVGNYGEGNREFSALHKPSLIPTKSPEYVIRMERTSNGSNHSPSWDVSVNIDAKPLVQSEQAKS